MTNKARDPAFLAWRTAYSSAAVSDCCAMVTGSALTAGTSAPIVVRGR